MRTFRTDAARRVMPQSIFERHYIACSVRDKDGEGEWWRPESSSLR